jgi:predicted porin
MFSKKQIVIACALAFGGTSLAYADDTADLKAKLQALQQQIDLLKNQLDKVTREQSEQKQAAVRPAPAVAAASTPGYTPVEIKDGDATILRIGNHDVQIYGNLDVSVDSSTKGFPGNNSADAVGKLGWQADLSTNLSYFGLRGKHSFDDNLEFVYQLETQLDITATAGTVNTTSNNDSVVKGALTSRNSYIGLAGADWGAVKFGKTDAPYKNSTARFNPFSGMLGDYSVIMGNTGGDNRVEFGTRMDHSLWYESPNLAGFHFDLLYSPGQNRSTDSSVQASGESSCAGGNSPGSGALPPSCNDGAWDSAWSADVNYTNGAFYAAAAYEMHRQVNRTSDVPSAAFPDGDPNDIGNESAWKVAAMYRFATGTTVGGIFEHTRRDIPGYLQYQNERSRPRATWLVVSQEVTPKDSVHFGWAHAGSTPGDPGQHNTPGGANPDNEANMYTFAYKHAFDKHLSWYTDYATTVNHFAAHYDLGAGGRGVTTDCHDGSDLAAFDPTTGAVVGAGPHCYAGGKLQGVSVGMKYVF